MPVRFSGFDKFVIRSFKLISERYRGLVDGSMDEYIAYPLTENIMGILEVLLSADQPATIIEKTGLI